jgi:hypothetical protein
MVISVKILLLGLQSFTVLIVGVDTLFAVITAYNTLVRKKLVHFIPFTNGQLFNCLLFGTHLSMLSKDVHLITHIEVGLGSLACALMVAYKMCPFGDV